MFCRNLDSNVDAICNIEEYHHHTEWAMVISGVAVALSIVLHGYMLMAGVLRAVKQFAIPLT
jgi:hypothetical protein